MTSRTDENEVIDAVAVEADAFAAEALPSETRDAPLAERSDRRVLGKDAAERRRRAFTFILLPLLLLTVTLLGGLRLSDPGLHFVFAAPSLLCLLLAAMTIVLFARGGLIALDGWFSERHSALTLAANSSVIFALFAATVQVYNSLLPERGIMFWIVAFCFVWTLVSYAFAEFDARRLVRGLGAMVGMAFVVKYLLLAGVTAPANESWMQAMLQNPSKEVLTWLLDLPRYSAATGYIQFFAVAGYVAALWLVPRRSPDD
ncbi:MAG: hypothetical protein ACK4S4_08455 [Pyrinomonadaceae bacterium]